MTRNLRLPMLLAYRTRHCRLRTPRLPPRFSGSLPAAASPRLCAARTASAGFFNSFCLQQERTAPALDSKYQLAPGGGLTVVARRADGSGIRLPGEGVVAISIDTGFTSVTISLPEARLKALGAVSSAIEVAPLTSILPVPWAGDPDPQSPEEIAQAIGPMRHLAAKIFDRSGEDPMPRVVGLLINELPPPEAVRPVALTNSFAKSSRLWAPVESALGVSLLRAHH
jgi:hypothetical protein